MLDRVLKVLFVFFNKRILIEFSGWILIFVWLQTYRTQAVFQRKHLLPFQRPNIDQGWGFVTIVSKDLPVEPFKGKILLTVKSGAGNGGREAKGRERIFEFGKLEEKLN